MPDVTEVTDADGVWRVTTQPSGVESRVLIEPSQEYLDAQEAEHQAAAKRQAERDFVRQREQSRNETRQKLSDSLALERAAAVVKDESTDLATITDLAPAFDDWEPGLEVEVGDLLYYGGTAVEVLQAHTTQADWPPPEVPALFKVYRDPDTADPWVQPAGAHDAYALGEQVTHNGRLWSSEVDDNVWEPGVFGWADLGPAEG